MIYTGRLKTVEASVIRDWFDALRREGDGCVSLMYAESGVDEFFVVMGWHRVRDGKDGFKVAWKIGVQRGDIAMMASDFDVDFRDPSNPDSGEVEDTTRIIDSVKRRIRGEWRWGSPSGYYSWEELAREIRKEARRVYRKWK